MTPVLSPAGAVESLLKSGVRVSERELRAKARRLGCYREIGRAMFFTEDDLAVLMIRDPQKSLAEWLVDQEAAEAAFQGQSNRNGVVYFVRSGDAVKIGFTTDLESRVKAFRTASPEEFDVWMTIEGSARLERYFHRMFAGDRIRNEWFKVSSAILDYVAMRKTAVRYGR